ncbi:class II aldolase/adducin family protein [Paracoccus yeei]|uniref:Class II aldolase/adducin N-terminal domain-containing protein n=1 Tax=Paracoccus yeei TaxID=147645 RepID=A0A5P2QY83_9RHOB|nr:class II aldolase/adducin family protein [Paracoccus yeei]QEU09502.1 hypothetical protein FOB51_16670 [Paracoccus yeei]
MTIQLAVNEAEERKLREDLAACFRLAALDGWDDLLMAHISARIPSEDAYLIQPQMLRFDEVTASRLHLLNRQGQHIRPSDEPTHAFAFPMHLAVYNAIPDAACVFHVHTKAGIAVSMQAQGLLPSNQYALWLGKIAYHDYEGFLWGKHEEEKLAKCFAESRIVILKGHGLIVWGRSIPEAYVLSYCLNRACEAQIASGTGPGGLEPYIPPQEVIDRVPGEAGIITDGNSPFVAMAWRSLQRRLARHAPDYTE